MAKPKILIIEDETDIRELIHYNLSREGYQVHVAGSGEEGLELAVTQSPDLIILDLMLPGIDGFAVCTRLRQDQRTQDIPVIMLTAKTGEGDVVLGLGLGADDYISKPFSPRQLVARIQAVLRRTQREPEERPQDRHQVGPILVDTSSHEVYVRGAAVGLTLAEFRLLLSLVTNPGRVMSRDQLLDKITAGESVIIDRNVDVHVRSVRKKLGTDGDMIVTVRGIGYKLAPAPSL